MDQSNQSENMVKSNDKSKPKAKEGKAKNQNIFDSVNTLNEGRKITLNAFKSGIVPIKPKKGEGRPSNLTVWLKILSSKQMFQRLQIALAQVKAGNTSENLLLLYEIRQIIYFLYWAKDIAKKVYNNIINLIKL